MICKKCKKDKDINEHSYRKERGKIGYRGMCKDCHNKYQKELREKDKKNYDKNTKKWVFKNKDRMREYAKDYAKERYHTDEVFKQKTLDRRHQHYYNNTEKERKRSRDYYYRVRIVRNAKS